MEEALHVAYETAQSTFSAGAGEMIDAVLALSDVSEQTWRIVSPLAPFGLGNPKPLFLFKDVTVVDVREFGKEKNHLELTLADSAVRGPEKKAVAFFSGLDSFSKPTVKGGKIDIVATLEKSYFAGRTTLRLRIIDVL